LKDVSQNIDDGVVNAFLSPQRPADEELLEALRRKVALLPSEVVPEDGVGFDETLGGPVVLGYHPNNAVVPGCVVTLKLFIVL
jgi:hypothetical protein